MGIDDSNRQAGRAMGDGDGMQYGNSPPALTGSTTRVLHPSRDEAAS